MSRKFKLLEIRCDTEAMWNEAKVKSETEQGRRKRKRDTDLIRRQEWNAQTPISNLTSDQITARVAAASQLFQRLIQAAVRGVPACTPLTFPCHDKGEGDQTRRKEKHSENKSSALFGALEGSDLISWSSFSSSVALSTSDNNGSCSGIEMMLAECRY